MAEITPPLVLRSKIGGVKVCYFIVLLIDIFVIFAIIYCNTEALKNNEALRITQYFQ